MIYWGTFPAKKDFIPYFQIIQTTEWQIETKAKDVCFPYLKHLFHWMVLGMNLTP